MDDPSVLQTTPWTKHLTYLHTVWRHSSPSECLGQWCSTKGRNSRPKLSCRSCLALSRPRTDWLFCICVGEVSDCPISDTWGLTLCGWLCPGSCRCVHGSSCRRRLWRSGNTSHENYTITQYTIYTSHENYTIPQYTIYTSDENYTIPQYTIYTSHEN